MNGIKPVVQAEDRRQGARRGGSESVCDHVTLLVGQAVGGGGVIALRGLVVPCPHELNRGQANQDRPQDRHPTAGKKRAKADAEEHGVEDKGARLRKFSQRIAIVALVRQTSPMSTIHLVPPDLHELYHVREWRNATGILATACPNEWQDIIDVLRTFRLYRSEVQAAGGRKSPIATQIDGGFYSRDWQEKQFQTAIKIDDQLFESPTHKIDCLKGRVALEVEWNNKDPFFDRDLNNFRLLFELRAIDVGVIITRGSELQTIFKSLGKGSSYGSSTTHHEKLWPRIEGGGGGGCPVLTFAIKPALYVDDGEPTAEQIAAFQNIPQ